MLVFLNDKCVRAIVQPVMRVVHLRGDGAVLVLQLLHGAEQGRVRHRQARLLEPVHHATTDLVICARRLVVLSLLFTRRPVHVE